MAEVTLVTASYNKPRYLREAAASVLAQSFRDLEWWIILDGPTSDTASAAAEIAAADPRARLFHEHVDEIDRFERYRPAIIVNEYYPLIESPYIMWLSDDDVLGPRGIESLRAALIATGEHVAYGDLLREREAVAGVYVPCDPILATMRFGPGSSLSPDCRIDGGQVMLTRDAWQSLGDWRLPTDMPQAFHCDGIFLVELARRYEFIQVREHVATHRFTLLSEWTRP